MDGAGFVRGSRRVIGRLGEGGRQSMWCGRHLWGQIVTIMETQLNSCSPETQIKRHFISGCCFLSVMELCFSPAADSPLPAPCPLGLCPCSAVWISLLLLAHAEGAERPGRSETR